MAAPDAAPEGWVARVIGASANNPVFTTLLVLVCACVGVVSLWQTPLDVIPDLSDTQVVVLTDWPGQSPDRVEDQVTYPVSTALLSTPGVRHVRGQSFFGLSFVYVIFEDGTDLYWARSRVVEDLVGLQARLPEGAKPVLGPEATGVGWVFQYALVDTSGTHDLADLRTLQDWHLRYALESVSGVAEVASVGGVVKQFQVDVDPMRLAAHDLTIDQLVHAIRASNKDAGGRLIEIAGHEHMIRGRGLLRGVQDLERVVVRASAPGQHLLLQDVADVGLGPDTRRGLADLDGQGEVVGGIVVMRQGADARRVIADVKSRLDDLRTGLPDGVEVRITYDRSELIDASVRTLWWTLLEEFLVVALVIGVFLAHPRSVWIVVLTVPVAMLLAFIPISGQGLTSNIMSLGGIAVAIGALVDGAIILVENVHQRLQTNPPKSLEERRHAMVRAMQDVGPSIFFSLLVITVSFLPVFALEQTEGRLFRPLAFTKTWAMLAGAGLAITLTPALVVLLLGKGTMPRDEPAPAKLVRSLYEPVVRWAIRRRRVVFAGASALLLATIPVFFSLEHEFMPPLNEGSLLYMPSSPPGMSVTEAGNALQVTNQLLMEIPEVRSVFGKVGRAETATDPAPLSMIETTILLKDRSQWRRGLTWEGLVAELDEALVVPGMPNLWWMPIQTRIEMLATGVRTPLAVQIFGDDLTVIERAAVQIEGALGGVPGTRSAFAERATGGFYVDIELDRDRAAMWGVRADDLHSVVARALGGQSITTLEEGRARHPVRVRVARHLRDDLDELGRVLIATPGGAQVPLSMVADIQHSTGPPMIRSEAGQLVGYVFVDPGERAAGSYVRDGKEVVTTLDLPEGVRLEWVGQYTHLRRAAGRLALLLPLTLFLVAFLLYVNTRSVAETAMVLLGIPFSLIGAVWLVWALDYHLSVAVGVGMIALAGLDAEMGVVMLLYLRLAHERHSAAGAPPEGESLIEAIVDGAAHRVRPKLMTVLCLMLGLMPVFWSSGAGADVMRRISAPIVGGLASSFLLELLVYPALYASWKGRK